jgi:hypothetical protein
LLRITTDKKDQEDESDLVVHFALVILEMGVL